jgi:hypothetical protein
LALKLNSDWCRVYALQIIGRDFIKDGALPQTPDCPSGGITYLRGQISNQQRPPSTDFLTVPSKSSGHEFELASLRHKFILFPQQTGT